MTEQELKQECIERLKILETKYGLSKNVRKAFETEDTVYYSEDLGGPFKGILYWLHNNPEWVQKVQDLENLYNMKVYHGILTHFSFGDVLSLLYVNTDKENWDEDRYLLKQSLPMVYALNLTDEWMSEFGSVQIEGYNGGLCRLS